MHRRSTLLIAMLIVSTQAAVCVGQLKAADEPAHAALVRQLGAASFGQRRLAARELTTLGMAARPALNWGMEQEDLEIRLGAHRLLVQILQADFAANIEDFLSGRSDDGGASVPGWQQFKKDAGDDPNIRRLYAEMLRAENSLIVAFDQHDSSLEALLIDRIRSCRQAPIMSDGQKLTISGPTLATLLFLGMHAQPAPESAVKLTTISPVTSHLFSFLSQTVSRQTVLQEAFSPQIRQLLTRWINEVIDREQQYGIRYALKLAPKFDLRELGTQTARKILQNPGTTFILIPDAAMILGRFGTVDDVKYLEPHLGSTQVFHTWSNPQLKKEPIRIQVRDAVLAMTIRLHGESPEAYGFDLLVPDEQTIYKPYSLGFLEDADRDEALAKWKARSKTIKAQLAAAGSDASQTDGETPAARQGDDTDK